MESSYAYNTNKQLQDEETSKQSEEEDILNYCFANADRDAAISPRQQHNNKTM